MKLKIIVMSIALSLLSAAFISDTAEAASPAATQSWVKNYVATNWTSSVVVSNVIVQTDERIASGVIPVLYILGTDDTTNSVNRAAAVLMQTVTPVVDGLLDGDMRFSEGGL